MKKIFIALVLLFLSARNSYAASLTTSISGSSPPYNENSEITIHVIVDINSTDGATYYLGAAFRRDSGNYCGLTLSEGNWVKYGSDGNKYFKINMQNNKWEGDIKIKIDNSSSSCKESGDYKLKIKRYTENSEFFDDQPEHTLAFNLPSPTATPTPTNTPTPNPTSTPTPTPTNIPTPTKTPTPTSKLTPTVTTRKTTPSPEAEVMAAKSTNERVQNPGGDQEQSEIELGSALGDLEKPKSESYNWWKLLIIMGAVIITGTVGVFLYNNHIKERSEELSQS